MVVFHCWVFARPEPGAVLDTVPDMFFNEWRLGLILFFVLSGYLLYRPWVRAGLDGDEGEAPATGRYLLRRAARIVPAYYLALAGSVALLWHLRGTEGVELPSASGLPLFFAFAQNYSSDTVMTLNQPTWTLSIEAAFYLALPLIGWAALRLARTRRGQVGVPLALVAIGLAWNAASGPVFPYDKLLPAALPYFAAGMLVAVLCERRELAPRAARWLVAAGIAAVAIDGVLHVEVIGGPIEAFTTRTLRDSLAGAGFAAILAAVVAAGAGAGWLSRRPLVALGTISYGIYLWHFPLLLALIAAGAAPRNMWGAVAVVLPATLLAATASWFAVERPAIRWAHSRRQNERRAELSLGPPLQRSREETLRSATPS